MEMIIEFEIEKSDDILISFFKKNRWPVSEIIRKPQGDKLYFSRNTLYYDNAHRLLWQAVILPDGDFLFYEENKKEFNLQVKKAQKDKIELEGVFTPSPELIGIAHGACQLGTVVLRTISDSTELSNMKKIETPLEKFNKYFILKESMEIRFKNQL